jgi:putative SOS response-associated peptidase YedK
VEDFEMCGRFTQRTPKERVAREFELQQIPDIEARYNIALTQNISAVRQMADEREAVMLKGGLYSWAKGDSMSAKARLCVRDGRIASGERRDDCARSTMKS